MHFTKFMINILFLFATVSCSRSHRCDYEDEFTHKLILKILIYAQEIKPILIFKHFSCVKRRIKILENTYYHL